MWETIQKYAKFIAALIGAAATSFSLLIPVDYQPYITAVVAFLTAISVLAIPNAVTTAQVKQIEEAGGYIPPSI